MLGQSADRFALVYYCALSKRTWFYTSMGEIRNKNGATFTLGNTSATGCGTRPFDLGIRHAF